MRESSTRHGVGATVGLSAAFGAFAFGAPSLFNGHYYELILVADPYTGTNNTWETARDARAPLPAARAWRETRHQPRHILRTRRIETRQAQRTREIDECNRARKVS